MSDTTLGIIIIIIIVVIGIASGGDIFRSGLSPISVDTNETRVNDAYINEGIYQSTNNSYVNSLGQTISPYTDKIRISNFTKPGTFEQQMTLVTDLAPEDAPILITGWKIRSVVTGQEAVIGGAARVAFEGVRDESPVMLGAHSRAVISLGTSPIGTSFRINKCMGYFEKNNSFNPSLSRSCPRPSEYAPALSRDFNNQCLNYIDSLYSCYEPRTRDYEELGLTNACETFLKTKINYRTCVENNINDADFLDSEWRLYTGYRGTLGISERDTFQLIDNAGRVVDSYTY